MKKEQHPEIKEDLASRYEGVSIGVKTLKDSINRNPDLSVDGLLSVIEPLAKEYSLNEEQTNYFKAVVEQYEGKHRAIRKYREMYSDDDKLFKACFGREPKGKIVVIVGPLTFHFRCFNVNDYVFAGRWEDEDKISDENRTWLEKTAALALIDTKLEDLGSGTVSIENVTWMMKFSEPKGGKESPEERERREKDQTERSRLHEEQHQFNRLFKPVDSRKSSQGLIANFIERNDTSSESTNHLISSLIKLERVFIEDKLWDEVLALYRGGRKRADDLYKNLQADVYNYRERHKDRIAEIPDKVYKKISKIQGVATSLEDIKIKTDKLFGKGYESDLQKWLNVISVLESKGYNSDEVIAYLCQEPIHNWPKLVERIKNKT